MFFLVIVNNATQPISVSWSNKIHRSRIKIAREKRANKQTRGKFERRWHLADMHFPDKGTKAYLDGI